LYDLQVERVVVQRGGIDLNAEIGIEVAVDVSFDVAGIEAELARAPCGDEGIVVADPGERLITGQQAVCIDAGEVELVAVSVGEGDDMILIVSPMLKNLKISAPAPPSRRSAPSPPVS
jgi:hypothetical protein